MEDVISVKKHSVWLPAHVIICEGYNQRRQGHLVQNGVYLCAPHAPGVTDANRGDDGSEFGEVP